MGGYSRQFLEVSSMSKERKRSTDGARVYTGFQFANLRGKVRFATFNGEFVRIALIDGFGVQELPDLRRFVAMWLGNDYCRVLIQVEDSTLGLNDLERRLAE